VTLTGFKSFPDRTRLEFAPGVSVIVGPNGCGKSNVTDAVLWALGEQSPLAVRGQSMQDVIFGGAHGQPARQAAEVEVVLDNADGAVELPWSELSIVRRLDRSGEGEYRLNGARCRLGDVLEMLSDTGLGKEAHSVVSQGRIEAIVTSRPRDRRLLIEEAAGLGKHRKRRRRAQLKLDRTQVNLDRALDVEREARTRLRPLKRQAEAAELHQRLEHQAVQARWELARDATRRLRAELGAAEAAATTARGGRDEVQGELAAVAARREAAERALSDGSRQRDALSSRFFAARSAGERLGLRLEEARATARAAAQSAQRRRARLAELGPEDEAADPEARDREQALRAELAGLDAQREGRLEAELAGLERDLAGAGEATRAAEAELERLTAELERADASGEAVRATLAQAERLAEAARREAARAGAELAAANQFLRAHAGAPGGGRTLADLLEVDPGYELALAAALDRRLGAALADDLADAALRLDAAGPDGGSALVAPAASAVADQPRGAVPEGERLLDHVRGEDPRALGLARGLLADVWVLELLDAAVVQRLSTISAVAVTRDGRVWSPASGELRQAAAGGGDRVLAERNRRDRLARESATAAGAEQRALAEVEVRAEAVARADAQRDRAQGLQRVGARGRDAAVEAERRAGWLIGERRKAPDQGPAAVRRAQLEAELGAERRLAERAERERDERHRTRAREQARLARALSVAPVAERLAGALAVAAEAVAAHMAGVQELLEADRRAGERLSQELRATSASEARAQQTLRERSETVTTAEVAAQRARDQAREGEAELETLAERLGLPAEPAEQELGEDEREALRVRLERLAARRQQLGPVNPLAQDEYADALAHVEELEGQREDLEAALRELRTLIRDTDRRIGEAFDETFRAAAGHFEQLVAHLFPGGRGALRLVRQDAGPRPLFGLAPESEAETAPGTPLGGRAPEAGGPPEAPPESAAEDEETAPEDALGVEIELAPAGKSTKRLSLLSGGEKSLTALAFLFAVFLARPCPFYILDEVEAALDDVNIDRFLTLVRRYSDRAQFIVVTHQKRTMEAADCLYGVSMGGDGVSQVVSRRLPQAA